MSVWWAFNRLLSHPKQNSTDKYEQTRRVSLYHHCVKISSFLSNSLTNVQSHLLLLYLVLTALARTPGWTGRVKLEDLRPHRISRTALMLLIIDIHLLSALNIYRPLPWRESSRSFARCVRTWLIVVAFFFPRRLQVLSLAEGVHIMCFISHICINDAPRIVRTHQWRAATPYLVSPYLAVLGIDLPVRPSPPCLSAFPYW